MIWIKQEIETEQVKHLATRYGMDMITASILIRRGIKDPEEICYFLENDTRFLHSPFCFVSMNKVVKKIKRTIASGEKISIYGDRDVDGITATVLIVESLRSLGAEVIWRVPIGDDDYGLSFSDIDNALEQGVKLLITVDCGISNIKEIKYAKSKGITTIIVDHHNPQDSLPPAYAIINPKVNDSGYPFRELSGCGVVSKLDWALHFSQSPFFGVVYCLVLIRPANQAYTIEAVKVLNCIEIERLRENLVPGYIKFTDTKIYRFSKNSQVYVFNKSEQQRHFARLFDTQYQQMAMTDLGDLVREVFPFLNNKSLLKIKEMSKLARYTAKSLSEIDMLKSLFISTIIKKQESFTNSCFNRFDLATLGTIADMMPLYNENRIIVKKGLALINSLERESLRELCLKKNLQGKEISTKEIAWNISPLINASGRLGEPDKAVSLFLSTKKDEIECLSDNLIILNERRKELGETIWQKMLNIAQECYKKTGQKFVLITDKSIKRGITGIIATRMMNYFKVPAVVIAQLPHKAVGSVRSIHGFPIQKFLAFFQDIFTDYGGHDYAAGFNFPLQKLDEFKKRFFKVIEEIVLPDEAQETIEIDAEIPKSYLTPDLFKVVEIFKPFGEAHPPIMFYTRNLFLESCEIVGKKEQVHLKLLLNTGSYRFPAMFWNSADLFGERFKVNEKVDLVYRMKKNFFMNTETLRLIVIDICRHNEKQVVNRLLNKETRKK